MVKGIKDKNNLFSPYERMNFQTKQIIQTEQAAN